VPSSGCGESELFDQSSQIVVFLGDPIPSDAYAFALVDVTDIRYVKSEEGVEVARSDRSKSESGGDLGVSVSGGGIASEME
jgi:hypothetical protein